MGLSTFPAHTTLFPINFGVNEDEITSLTHSHNQKASSELKSIRLISLSPILKQFVTLISKVLLWKSGKVEIES